jgi:manganese transport protein
MTQTAFDDGANVSLSARTVAAGREALAGQRRGLAAFLPFAGPAIIASIAYMDPGNFATNIEAGARYGYALLWVVLAANVTAMLFQAQSAKLGIVTGHSLAQLCRETLPRPLVYLMWALSEVSAMATDVAEFLGAALGLSLLSNLPLMLCLVVTGLVTYAVLMIQRTGFRPMEILIGLFVAVIGLCYLVELSIAPPDWAGVASGTFLPRLPDSHAVTLAVGIIGATVMPHAIYLHSSLTQGRMPTRDDGEIGRVLAWSNREVLLALGFAGLVNMAMVSMSAAVFHAGHGDVAEIETAYRTLTPLLGGAAAAIFMLSLLASGFSSSVVGTMAGQTIMQDFVSFSIPIWARRVITMIPAFVVVGLGVSTTTALVMSQVVLSLVLPVPMVALLYISARRDIMGRFVNTPMMTALGIVAATLVGLLNILLLLSLAGMPIPGLGD